MKLDEEYPIKDLQNILNKYMGCDLSNEIIARINNDLNMFTYELGIKFDILQNDYKHIQFNIWSGVNFEINPKNIFTAMLLFGKYVPYIHTVGLDKFEFNDGSFICHDYNRAEYVFKPIKQHTNN
jgi:hypothetical protein